MREDQGEVHVESHTVRSHGCTLITKHKHDWLILALLGAAELTLYLINPFYRYVNRDTMADLKYPMKNSTVPFWSVPFYAVILPIAIFAFIYYRRRDVYDLHNSILGILYSVLITGFITDALKDATGRPRPDLFWRCFPDGIEVYDQSGDAVCHGKRRIVNEGYKGFPSGHTSWSFAGMVFLSLYLAGKLRVFNRKGYMTKVCLVILPWLVATFVGISLIDDYWHHWEDVVAGAILGTVITMICYLQFYPPPYHAQGWGPWAYFHMLEGQHANTHAHATSEATHTNNVPNGLNGQDLEAQVRNPQDEQSGHTFMGLGFTHDSKQQCEEKH